MTITLKRYYGSGPKKKKKKKKNKGDKKVDAAKVEDAALTLPSMKNDEIKLSPEEIDQIASTPMSEDSDDDLSPNSRRLREEIRLSRNSPPLMEPEPEPEPEALQSRIQSGQKIPNTGLNEFEYTIFENVVNYPVLFSKEIIDKEPLIKGHSQKLLQYIKSPPSILPDEWNIINLDDEVPIYHINKVPGEGGYMTIQKTNPLFEKIKIKGEDIIIFIDLAINGLKFIDSIIKDIFLQKFYEIVEKLDEGGFDVTQDNIERIENSIDFLVSDFAWKLKKNRLKNGDFNSNEIFTLKKYFNNTFFLSKSIILLDENKIHYKFINIEEGTDINILTLKKIIIKEFDNISIYDVIIKGNGSKILSDETKLLEYISDNDNKLYINSNQLISISENISRRLSDYAVVDDVIEKIRSGAADSVVKEHNKRMTKNRERWKRFGSTRVQSENRRRAKEAARESENIRESLRSLSRRLLDTASQYASDELAIPERYSDRYKQIQKLQERINFLRINIDAKASEIIELRRKMDELKIKGHNISNENKILKDKIIKLELENKQLSDSNKLLSGSRSEPEPEPTYATNKYDRTRLNTQKAIENKIKTEGWEVNTTGGHPNYKKEVKYISKIGTGTYVLQLSQSVTGVTSGDFGATVDNLNKAEKELEEFRMNQQVEALITSLNMTEK